MKDPKCPSCEETVSPLDNYCAYCGCELPDEITEHEFDENLYD